MQRNTWDLLPSWYFPLCFWGPLEKLNLCAKKRMFEKLQGFFSPCTFFHSRNWKTKSVFHCAAFPSLVWWACSLVPRRFDHRIMREKLTLTPKFQFLRHLKNLTFDIIFYPYFLATMTAHGEPQMPIETIKWLLELKRIAWLRIMTHTHSQAWMAQVGRAPNIT